MTPAPKHGARCTCDFCEEARPERPPTRAASFSLRLTPELHAWVLANGGGVLVRELLEHARADTLGSLHSLEQLQKEES